MNDSDISIEKIEAGLQEITKGHYKELHRSAIHMIQDNLNDPVPYLLLAKLSFDHENYTKALQLCEKAIALSQNNPYCLTYYAQFLSHLGRQVEAKNAADSAAALNPNMAHLADTLGVVYSRTGFHELAMPWFQRAVNLNPVPANYHYNLAASQQFLGDFKRAKQSYVNTLDRDPNAYRALASLINLNKQSDTNNNLKELETAFARNEQDDNATLHIGHAIAKTYEDLGNYSTSLEWLHRAKKGKLSSNTRMAYDDIFAAAKKTVSLDDETASKINGEAPIFIVGLPRTGTTLVDRIISSHCDVEAAGELNLFANLIKSAAKTNSNLVMDAETLSRSSELDLKKVGECYLAQTQDLRRDSLRFTDKMPLNFFYAALIHKALPNARIIALRRGAMDSCLSNYRQLLTVQHSYYDYTYDLTATATFFTQFDDLMRHWRAHLSSACFMEIRYEDIVYDQENQTRKLIDFCGLDWDEACMNFHQNTAPVSTASSVQVRQPLYSKSIDRWKRYDNALADLHTALGDLANT